MRTPLVSIVIPAYNYAHYIVDTIDSALAQTYINMEVIVLDDGSTDNTAELVKAYGSRINYYYQSNSGLSAARNNGFNKTRGDFVVFIDADDKLHPDFVSQTVAMAASHPEVAFVYTQQQYFEASTYTTTFGEYSIDKLKQANFIPACTLIRAKVLRYFSYDARFTSWEDWDFYLTLAEYGFSGVLLNKPLVLYRKHNDQKSMLDTFATKTKIHTLKKLRYKHWRLYGIMETLRFTLWYWRNRKLN